MIIEMMQYYGLTKELKNAGYFVDESYGPMFEDLKKYMPSGDLIALTGPIGVGKTSSLHRIMIDLEKEVRNSVETDRRFRLNPTA